MAAPSMEWWPLGQREATEKPLILKFLVFFFDSF